jgi:hypothetical protein
MKKTISVVQYVICDVCTAVDTLPITVYRVGQNRILTVHTIYFKYTVMHGVYIRFWPTLAVSVQHTHGLPLFVGSPAPILRN